MCIVACALPHAHRHKNGRRPVTRPPPTLYARGVSRPSSQDRSPTLGLLLGLFITLSAVVAYSAYLTWQVTGLRHLQVEMVDRDRKDSL